MSAQILSYDAFLINLVSISKCSLRFTCIKLHKSIYQGKFGDQWLVFSLGTVDGSVG